METETLRTLILKLTEQEAGWLLKRLNAPLAPTPAPPATYPGAAMAVDSATRENFLHSLKSALEDFHTR